MKNNYEKLRSRINELLPDRLKLEFGCEVMVQAQGGSSVRDYEIKVVVVDAWMHEGVGIAARLDPMQVIRITNGANYSDTQIRRSLGKPLTIEDVLRALKGEYLISNTGWLHEIEGSGPIARMHHTPIRFDLTKPLSAPENESACAAVLKLLTL